MLMKRAGFVVSIKCKDAELEIQLKEASTENADFWGYREVQRLVRA